MPGDRPVQILVLHNPSRLVVGSSRFGVFVHDLITESWVLPSYSGIGMNASFHAELLTGVPGDSLTLYVASTKWVGSNAEKHLIGRSEDGGFSWRRSDTGIPESDTWFRFSHSLAVDPFHPDTLLWGGSSQHRYISRNRGESWEMLAQEFVSETFLLDFDRNEAGHVVGASFLLDHPDQFYPLTGLTYSDDGGVTWEQGWPMDLESWPDLPPLPNCLFQHAVHPARWWSGWNDRFSHIDDGPLCLMESLDGGRTWQAHSTPPPGCHEVIKVLADPFQPTRLWVLGDAALFTTDDLGQNWDEVSPEDYHYRYYRDMAFDTVSGDLYLARDNSGVVRRNYTTGSWTTLPDNPFEHASFSKVSAVGDQFFLHATAIGCIESAAPPEWNPLLWDLGVPDAGHTAYAVNGENHLRRALFTGYYPEQQNQTRIHFTNDGGMSWTAGVHVDPEYASIPDEALFAGPDSVLLLSHTPNRLDAFTVDGFTSIATLPNGPYYDWRVHGDTLLLASDYGIHSSIDRGNTWNLWSREGESFRTFGGSGRPGTPLLTCTHDFLYLSMDGGLTFQQHGPVPSYAAFSLEIIGDTWLLSARSPGEVYKHSPGDTGWVGWGEGLPEDFRPLELSGAQSGVLLRGASYMAGVPGFFWRGLTQDVEDAGWLPATEAVWMGNVYPNPSNAVVNVEVIVQRGETYRLSLYNLLGQAVHTLHEGPGAPGTHRILLDAQNLASGTYMLRLEGVDYSHSRVLTIVR